jgi:competence protein ComEA
MHRRLVCGACALLLALGGAGAWAAPKRKAAPSRTPTPTNVNTANVLELTHLPGIGVRRAQAIVNYREEHGSFRTKSGLLDIPGIGKKTFEKLEPLISVRDRKAAPF